MILRWLAALTALFLAASAHAQTQNRTLDVPTNAAWQHAATQIILPSRVTGFTREAVRDFGAEEMDVNAAYQDDAAGVTVTLYIYRTMTPSVPLWFDRALTAIRLRPEYRQDNAPTPAITAFARPGATVASGLRASIDVGGPDVASTAVAIVPLGDFLVKVRISAQRLDRAALDARLTRFLEGLRWPAPAAIEPVAVPVADCERPLRLRNARIVRTGGADVLMDAMMGAVQLRDGEDAAPPPVYCREPGAARLEWGLYRANASAESYLIALNDAGVAISVGEALNISALAGGGPSQRRYSVTLLERHTSGVYPSFNRLPLPQQAVTLVLGESAVSVTTDGR